MTLAFAAILGFSTQLTDINVQKIASFALKIYSIVLVGFSIKDKLDKN